MFVLRSAQLILVYIKIFPVIGNDFGQQRFAETWRGFVVAWGNVGAFEHICHMLCGVRSTRVIFRR